MPRWNGTTKQRGYGSGHQAIGKAYRAIYRPGQPCVECGQPLTGPAASHDLAHDHVNGGYKGLAHAACNRAEGATRGNRLQPRYLATMAGGDTRCKTCGKTYHYAAKLCEVCGVHYHPSGGAVRTCSRACGVQLRRRIYGYAGSKPAQPKPPKPPQICQSCGQSFTASNGALHCPACREVRPPGGWPSSQVVYYTCRYCDNVGITTARGTTREVCERRPCQLLRRKANNWRVRKGMELPPALIAAATASRNW